MLLVYGWIYECGILKHADRICRKRLEDSHFLPLPRISYNNSGKKMQKCWIPINVWITYQHFWSPPTCTHTWVFLQLIIMPAMFPCMRVCKCASLAPLESSNINGAKDSYTDKFQHLLLRDLYCWNLSFLPQRVLSLIDLRQKVNEWLGYNYRFVTVGSRVNSFREKVSTGPGISLFIILRPVEVTFSQCWGFTLDKEKGKRLQAWIFLSAQRHLDYRQIFLVFVDCR